MKYKQKYTDFPYCYGEERSFVSTMSSLSKHESEQNAAISSNKELIEKNTQNDLANAELDKQQSLDIEDLRKRVTALEEALKNLSGSTDVNISSTITLWPDDNIPTNEDEKEMLTLKSEDSFDQLIGKIAYAIKSLNNTVDGDIFKF